MVRPPRNLLLCNDSYFHVAWRCHNREWLLNNDIAKQKYYDLLLKYKDRHLVTFYAYQLMENHLHLVGHMAILEEFSALFRIVNGLFARFMNRSLKRCGQLIADRFISKRITDDRQMLSVMIYNDLNGVRAGRDKSPEESEWSSYRHYAYGSRDELIITAPSYLALSDCPAKRRKEYRIFVRGMMKSV